MKAIMLLYTILFFFNPNAWADNTHQSAAYIGTVGPQPKVIFNQVSNHDHNDYFSFDVTISGQYQFTLDQMTDNASLGVFRIDGSLIGYSINQGTTPEVLKYQLNKGRYVVRIASWQLTANTNYRLTIKNQSLVVRPPSRPINPWPRIPRPNPTSPQLGNITIRGIPYFDHSRYASLSTSQVLLGDYFNLNTQTMNFNQGGQVKVFIQEVNGHSGFGITGYELRGVNAYGKNLQIQAPWLHMFKNRKFNVTVFQYTGSKNHYAHAGVITFK